MNSRGLLRDIVPELIRRGLPAEYAGRAAAELADHHRDLVDELRCAGFDESAAQTEASRRLGDNRTIIKSTVCGYQRRYWCGRWPLMTFLLAPMPSCVAAYAAAAWSLIAIIQFLGKTGLTESAEFNVVMSQAPLVLKYAVLISLFVAVPSLMAYAFARLAKRAALGLAWMVLAGILIGLTAGTVRIERAGFDTGRVAYDRPGGSPLAKQPSFWLEMAFFEPAYWYSPNVVRWYTGNTMQLCQLLLPVVAAGGVYLRGRQVALRAQRLAFGGS
jgi:hypothetical protein